MKGTSRAKYEKCHCTLHIPPMLPNSSRYSDFLPIDEKIVVSLPNDTTNKFSNTIGVPR
jgi:ABC-type metal ion transport system substrate-binding protein